MKKIQLLFLLVALSNVLAAQQKPQKTTSDKSVVVENEHKIVIQLSTSDTIMHKALMKQLNNIITASPTSLIEVVCHGPGLNILISGKTIVNEKIAKFKKQNIEFVACEFSMTQLNITKDMLIPEAGSVKFGILEIVGKQEAGWSYIKSGF